MNELFTFMLERQGRFYAKHPKPYLGLVNAASKRSAGVILLKLLVASQDQERLKSNFPQNLDTPFLAALNSLAVDLEVNVVARCAGLIECVQNDPAPSSHFPETFAHGELIRASMREVRFIHRSVQDCLIENENGAILFRTAHIAEQDALKRLMTASAIRRFINANHSNMDMTFRYARKIYTGF
jgi:hypothetical protein